MLTSCSAKSPRNPYVLYEVYENIASRYCRDARSIKIKTAEKRLRGGTGGAWSSALVRHFEEGKSRGNSGEEARDDRFENSVVLRSRRKIHRVSQHHCKLLSLNRPEACFSLRGADCVYFRTCTAFSEAWWCLPFNGPTIPVGCRPVRTTRSADDSRGPLCRGCTFLRVR